MNFFFVDRILPFLKDNSLEILNNLNLFQFYINRFGVGLNISKNIVKNTLTHGSMRVNMYNINIINKKIKLVFINSIENLDLPLKQKMNDTIKKDIFLYTYRGDRYLLKLPLNGQRRRSNNKTTKRIKLIN